MEHYSATGSHHDWPCGRGFDTWYGFDGALIDHWNPELHRYNKPIDLYPEPGKHLSEDLVDEGIARIRDHRIDVPERPFFLYFAFGACHWLHHVRGSTSSGTLRCTRRI
jgi:arylsulfatase A-like enzyme